MTERVSNEERDAITRLTQAGLERVEARVAVLLAARGYFRPLPDLIATLQHYAGLEDARATSAAIDSLITAGVVTRATTPLGNVMVGPSPDIASRLATHVGDMALEPALVAIRRTSDADIAVIGPLRDGTSYESYAERLRDAQCDIRMPVVMTDPSALETVEILRARAAMGVKVRVLGAAPKVVGRLRGESQVAAAKTRIAAWRQIARENANIEYRLTDHSEDMLFATSILIDGEVLRMVLHDPYHERSKEGLVLEVGGGGGKGINLVRDFAARFDIAWDHARCPGVAGHILNLVQASGLLLLAGGLFAFSYFTADMGGTLGKILGTHWQPLGFNIASGSVGAAIVAWWQRVRRRAAERHALASGA